MTIGSGDATILRTGARHVVKPIINAVPWVEVDTTQINQLNFSYPTSQLNVDTMANYADIKPGHMVLIGTSAGAWDVAIGVVRLAPTSTVLYVDAKGLGEPGVPVDIEQEYANNLYVTILKYRPPWGLLSSIRGKKFYKKYDVKYTNQNLRPDPVVVMGPWRQAWIDETLTYVDVALDASDSWAWGNATITDYLWDLDGGSVQSGSLTSPALTGRFNAGFYELTCEVTDSFGQVHEGYRYLWVNTIDRTSQWSPLSYRLPLTIVSDNQGRDGRELILQLDANLTSELFPNQGFLLTEDATWGGDSLSDDSELVDSFAGYSHQLDWSAALSERQVQLKVASPCTVAKDVPMATQYMQEKAAPGDWTQVPRKLSNPVGAFHYLTHWHAPYLLDGHDWLFDASLTTYRRQIFAFKQLTLQGQLGELGELFLGNIGSMSDGTTVMRRNPIYFNATDKASHPVKWTWDGGDFLPPLKQSWRRRMQTGQVYAYAFSYSGGKEPIPYAAVAPGHSQGQGRGKAELTPFIVTELQGQDRVNEVAGLHYAYLNRKTQNFQLTADRNLDIAEPAELNQWHAINVDAADLPINEGLSTIKLLPVSVRRKWTHGGSVKEVAVEFEVNTFGFPGVYIPVNRSAADTWDLWNWQPGIIDPYKPVWPDLNAALSTEIPGWVFAALGQGQLARTNTFLDENVSWENVTGFNGQAIDVAIDYHSTYITGGSGALGLWLLTWSPSVGELYVYYVDDATTPVQDIDFTTPVLTIAVPDTYDEFTGVARLVPSRETADFVAVLVQDSTGTELYRTEDAFATSKNDTLATIGSNDEYYLGVGLSVFEDEVYALVPNGSTASDGAVEYKLMSALTYAATPSTVANIPTDHFVYSDSPVAAYASGSVLVGTRKLGVTYSVPDLIPINFEGDGTDFSSYSLGSGATTHVNPGYFGTDKVAYNEHAEVLLNFTSPVEIAVTIDMVAEHAFGGDITFDYYATFNQSGMNGKRIEVQVGLLDANDLEYATYYRTLLGPLDGVALGSYTETGVTIPWDDIPQARDNPPVKVALRVDLSWEAWGGSGGDVLLFLDNVDFGTATPAYTEYNTEFFLQKVTAIATTPVWTDITGNSRGPIHTYGISVNPNAMTTEVSILGVLPDGIVTNLEKTSNFGSTWTLQRRTSAERGIKRSDNAMILWGTNLLALSDNLGDRGYDRMGNMRTTVGYPGAIRAVTGVL